MGTSLLAVRFEDGTVLYGGYQNTSDIVESCKLVKNFDNYSDSEDIDCLCGGSEYVKICTNYGLGFYWSGKACKKCKVVTDGLEPLGDLYGNFISDYKMGLPEWFPTKYRYR